MKPRDRVAAWIVTGPLGHLWSVVADMAVLLARYGWSRAVSSRLGRVRTDRINRRR